MSQTPDIAAAALQHVARLQSELARDVAELEGKELAQGRQLASEVAAALRQLAGALEGQRKRP